MVKSAIPQDRRDSYVYVIFRPDGRPCYVGKGCGRRWNTHANKTHNLHLRAIYENAGGVLPRVKVREGISDHEAQQTEIALIKAIGRKKDGGPLTNQTAGGEGMLGHPMSDAHKAKLVLANKGRPITDAHRQAMRDAQKGRFVSENTKAKLAAISTGKTYSAETRAKLSASHIGVPKPPRSVAHCAALSATHTARLKNEVGRAMMRRARAIQLAAGLSDEARAKLVTSQRARRDREAKARCKDQPELSL